MTVSCPAGEQDVHTLKYIVTHVFLPLRLPGEDDNNIPNYYSLAGSIATVAHRYIDYIDSGNVPLWRSISKMLDNLQTAIQLQSLDWSKAVLQLRNMVAGDVLAYFIRSQNAAVVFRRQKHVTVCESFEVSPRAEDVMGAKAKLVCSYPGPAVEIPNAVFDNENFLAELTNFLAHMNKDVILDAAATTRKAQSVVHETRDTSHPRYITQLFTGILRSVGSPADIVRISKRVGDDVVWDNSELPWRRSPLWLLVRVVLQTSLERSGLGRGSYKAFMLFFMCCLAKEKNCADLPNDQLQSILAKISRRLRKLGSFSPNWLSDMVLQTCTSLRSALTGRWGQIQAVQRASPVWNPSQLDLTQDVQLSLSASRDYLRNVLAKDTTISHNLFEPNHHRRGALCDFLSSDASFFKKAYRAESHIALYDVERAVEHGIDNWVEQVTDNDEACEKLEALANEYSSCALEMYTNNPELLSVMLLTMIELWIALDKIAIKEIPMLADYSPEVPMTLLEGLLLSKSLSLDRLLLAHQYLSSRHSLRRWSVFSPQVTINSFAVRFYRGSSHLQCLKSRIEEVARREVCEKVAELEKRVARYDELQQRAAFIGHEYSTNRHGATYHAGWCNKCSIEREYENMKIDVHEWPLPAKQLDAEVVVFELDCPVSFNMWRTATFHLLVNICSPFVEPEEPYIQLNQYEALQPYLVQHPRSRITLASNTKPFVKTHYRGVSIPTEKEQVCLKNGLTLYGFDSHACITTSGALGRVDISKYCTHQLQDKSPYQELWKYVVGTSHTSNEVMANQRDCHKDLSIHEYTSFGHLRSGGLLQWLNVLRELRSRSLSFHRSEVHLLFAQAVSQVGPVAHTGPTWHQEIQRSSFYLALLGELESLLRDIERNWQEAVTMDTISFLLRRILASSPEEAIALKVLGLLRDVRDKTFEWVKELSVKLAGSPKDEVAKSLKDEELCKFLLNTAIICRSTFDVDPPMIRKLLHSAEDVQVLLSTAILIHDHTPSPVPSLPAYSRLLLDRDRRLSLVLESFVSDVIKADDKGVDLAISWLWNNYRPGSKWVPLRHPNSRWFSCVTAAAAEQRSQVVHLNLLDGSLLVDGKPIGRLPGEIQRHPLFNLIFDTKVLEVIPSDLPGMDYSTRGFISAHQVHFSLRDESLVIQAKRKTSGSDNSETIELIPQEKLKGDLPMVLIEGYAHWLNLSTSVMEIRPLHAVWESSPENWSINCTPGQYRMYKGQERLVDIRSQSWSMISELLKPLDIRHNLIVTISPMESQEISPLLQLSVHLPRYGLSFYVDEDGDLQSHNIRGMVYDNNQCIGTLFGLVSRLVLRPKFAKDVDAEEVFQRYVLIPEGEVSFQIHGHHVCVRVNTCHLHQVTYQTYRVDTDLGCLAGNVGLTNKLYCAYLHALTSGCGTDPLTDRSGTEEALSILRSASCWSIMKFSPRDAELLGLIASISPPRTWYPKHLRCMQTVEWHDLPVNSQHHDLYVACKKIKDHYKRIGMFQGGLSATPFKKFPSRDDHLLERSAWRAAYMYPPEFSGQPSGTRPDVSYASRDLVNSDEHRAYTAATTVYTRTAYSETGTNSILRMLDTWKGRVESDGKHSIRYKKSWLKPELPLIWLQTYDLLRKGDEGKWFKMLFSLPAMAYATPELADLVPAFVAFATDSQFCSEDPPRYTRPYDLSEGYCPSKGSIQSHVCSSAHPFHRSPESDERAKAGESECSLRERQRNMYYDRRNRDAEDTAILLTRAWPCEALPHCSLSSRLYDVAEFMDWAREHFSACYRNLKLKEHLTRVQNILNLVYLRSSPPLTIQYSFDPSQTDPSPVSWAFTMDELFSRLTPSLQTHYGPQYKIRMANILPSSTASLHQLIATAEANTVNPFQRKYISALRTSAQSFGREESVGTYDLTEMPATEEFLENYALCRCRYIQAFRKLRLRLSPRSSNEQALERAGQWPRITSHAIFCCLASNSPIALSSDWKKCLVQFTLLALELQRARRLLKLSLDGFHAELCKELQNEGCNGWDAKDHPDWLIVQLQSNFFVRRVQAEVAHEMISPRSGNNTAMQLNMGEGKSSVIVPIVAVDLADGDQLVRVIVPKALTAQMFNILVDRLSGLLNRRIYFIPFSRSLKINPQNVSSLHELMSECVRERGVLVLQPEHVLSLKLVSVEKQLPEEKDRQLAIKLLELQRWLHAHSRDILDESDEILHVRYQLVYTVGNQQHMEGFPDRWTSTQQVLGLVNRHASPLRDLFPLGVEYEPGPSGSFAHFRILHEDAGRELISLVLQDIMDGILPNFNFGQLPSSFKNAIRSFLSCEKVEAVQIETVTKYSLQTAQWGGLLLLRGLLARGILLFALKERRWRVDYGPAPTRTMLAVPYRAKDVPAQRAEFGHPDVAITLTCLSYYYGGLTDEQLMVSFEILLRQDDPALDYDLWIRDCSDVPETLRTVKGVNIKSADEWKNLLFPLFSRNRETINFYLSSVVFPKEAKEFPSKLSCSGWDLAEKKQRVLTGFSGTNDGQYLLPLHITQRDPDHQRGTNAKVLSYLLQPENNHYMCMTHENGNRQTSDEFLRILVSQNPEIRVLLDVGAQILDLENRQLAKAWLNIHTAASAAIYFSDEDELTVVTRDGRTQLLLSSPFAQQLDQCVIYLDDAHTRGTDIKFPIGFRAAVTLGPKVTKDRLVQGCMRMRKLGHGHSIMFFAPPEIDRRIRSVENKINGSLEGINTMDILHWAIRETCDDIRQRTPHWAQQGTDHTTRYAAWTSFCDHELSSTNLSERWLQPEAKKLEELYGPHNTFKSVLTTPNIRSRCIELGVLSLHNVSMDEEQEREIIHELEREHQMERPPRLPPARHSIHPDVASFVQTGVVPSCSDSFRPVFETLSATSAGTQEAHIWSPFVLATKDFWETVSSSNGLDEYLRPVCWVVSGESARGDNVLVIVSPYEANSLLPQIRANNVRLHVYTPRVNKSMKPCDDLDFYSISMNPRGWTPPRSLMDQLNVFAGQLYLKDYKTYIRLCRFLCIYAKDLEGREDIKAECDGFILPSNRPCGWDAAHTFQQTPLPFLKKLMGIRRKGMRFAPTHMGKMLDARVILEDDFDDS